MSPDVLRDDKESCEPLLESVGRLKGRLWLLLVRLSSELGFRFSMTSAASNDNRCHPIRQEGIVRLAAGQAVLRRRKSIRPLAALLLRRRTAPRAPITLMPCPAAGPLS